MANGSGPVAQEFAEWLKATRQGWTQSLKTPPAKWGHKQRLVYACAGSFTWFGGTAFLLVLSDPRFLNFAMGGLVSALGVSFIVLLSFWFGWLVAFVDRKAGPIRLFLDGVLLPAATLAVISLSARRIRPAQVESGPVSLQVPSASTSTSTPERPQTTSGSAPTTQEPSEPDAQGPSEPDAQEPNDTELGNGTLN